MRDKKFQEGKLSGLKDSRKIKLPNKTPVERKAEYEKRKAEFATRKGTPRPPKVASPRTTGPMDMPTAAPRTTGPMDMPKAPVKNPMGMGPKAPSPRPMTQTGAKTMAAMGKPQNIMKKPGFKNGGMCAPKKGKK
jgi:hypothetical protein